LQAESGPEQALKRDTVVWAFDRLVWRPELFRDDALALIVPIEAVVLEAFEEIVAVLVVDPAPEEVVLEAMRMEVRRESWATIFAVCFFLYLFEWKRRKNMKKDYEL